MLKRIIFWKKNDKHHSQIEEAVGAKMAMINIDECFVEAEQCKDICRHQLNVTGGFHLVDGNSTALVGLQIETYALCSVRFENTNGEEKDLDEGLSIYSERRFAFRKKSDYK